MALYDMTGLKADAQTTGDSLVELTRTSFAAQQIQERQHLQAALRDGSTCSASTATALAVAEEGELPVDA